MHHKKMAADVHATQLLCKRGPSVRDGCHQRLLGGTGTRPGWAPGFEQGHGEANKGPEAATKMPMGSESAAQAGRSGAEQQVALGWFRRRKRRWRGPGSGLQGSEGQLQQGGQAPALPRAERRTRSHGWKRQQNELILEIIENSV